MVRNYKRKTERGQYGDVKLAEALETLSEGVPLIRVSRDFGIPARTLRRHRDKKVSQPGIIIMGRHKKVFSDDVEKELKDHIIDMQRRMYGLTTTDLRRLAFDVADRAQISNPFNKESQMAGIDWLQKFLGRNNLSLRQPQGTSMSRIIGFNRPKVNQFFELYKSLLLSQNFPANKIWNMDETGLTTVQKPLKVMALKGTKQVGKVTSAERGELSTFICAFNAAGGYLPPMYIFPRKRMVDSLMNGAPPQSVGFANPSGWSDSELFLKWLQHFVSFTNVSKESKHIILLDGHHSHKTLAAVEYCRDYGIEMLTFPPHSTHRMQPLDRSYFKSLKSAFNASADSWMIANPGKRISIYEIAEISGKAFLRSATAEKAVNGFKTCGLWPYDATIFSAKDFIGAEMTEEDIPGLTPSSVLSQSAQVNGTMSNASALFSAHTIASSDKDAAHQTTSSGPISIENDFAPPTTSIEPESVRNKSVPLAPPTEPVSLPTTFNTSDFTEKQSAPVTSSSSFDRLSLHTKVIQTFGDGRCFFRSIVTGLDVDLQIANRNDSGLLIYPKDAELEMKKADELRSNATTYLKNHIEEFNAFDEEHVNADLPPGIRYNSLANRIDAMSNPTTMPGELEIVATSRFLQRPISIVDKQTRIISRYGEDLLHHQPLFVQFQSVGEDVGHYDCVCISDQLAIGTSSKEIKNYIRALSPLPKISNKRPRTRKAESAVLLTSSPYKDILLTKQNQQKHPKQRKETCKKTAKPAKQKKRKRNEKSFTDETDDEEWPCIICCEAYSTTRPGDVWVQCQICKKWAHEVCTPGTRQFICPNCESDVESE